MPSVATLTQRHRAQQLLIRGDVDAKIRRLWPLLAPTSLDASYEVFAAQTKILIRQSRLTSAGAAVGYLKQVRPAYGVKGRPTIEMAGSLDDDQFEATLHSQSVAAVKAASVGGSAISEAMRIGLSQTSGAMVRLALNGGRETVTGSVAADTAGQGWRRVLGGGGCDFCQMLAGRGFVYSEDSVDFEAHSRCACTAEPQYG